MAIPDLTVGDWETAYLDVAPYDDTTAVTLAIHSPADTSLAGTAATVDAGVVLVNDDGVNVKRFTASAVQYPAGGWWVRSWQVTGVGASEPDERFFVAPNPTAGGPMWSPTREQVADYIPERTVEIDRLSSGQPVLTFTADTRPSARQVDRQIIGAVGWITTACGDLDDTLHEAASDVAAIRAAGMAEISWPVRDGDISAGQALLAQADAGLKSLKERNDLLTVAPVDPDKNLLLPVYSFPPAPSWGDHLL